MHKKILRFALPNIVSNITIPLLGMVDLAIVGHIGGAEMIAGMAIGTAIFNLLYWNFGFLRMGTSGFAAQAYGRRDFADAFRTLFRAIAVAVLIALVIWALQTPIEWGALWIMDGSDVVEGYASEYYRARIWAAPATLAMYAFYGWFIGMQNAKTPMWIAIILNVIHLIASYVLAVPMGMGIKGVAYGTVIAQWLGVVMSIFIIRKYYGRIFHKEYFSDLLHRADLAKFFRVNRDIFFRTLCMVIVFTFFTSASSSMGDATLAANTLMLQLFTLFSYIMDGFAYSGEALAGRYYGAGNRALLRKSVGVIFLWGTLIAILFTALYAFFGENLLRIFSDDPQVLASTRDYVWWCAAIPMISFSAFLMDGILVGMSQAKFMRNMMVIATAAFFAVYYYYRPEMGNDALWLAFAIFLGARGVLQLVGSYKHFAPK